jgi:hypothetical protein
MRRGLTLLAILAMLAVPGTAGAQDIRINPVPPGVKPQWTQVPGATPVSWAPNLPTDVFHYRGKYYFFWEEIFYSGPKPEGPWKVVQKVPRVFYDVDPAYFKTVKKAGETPGTPAATGEAPPSKAKIIDIPPTAPLAPAPGPEPPGEPPAPPKVM